jgi:hypothetical protein
MKLLCRAILVLFLVGVLGVTGTIAVVAYRFGWDCVQVGMQYPASGIGDVCREDGWVRKDGGGTIDTTPPEPGTYDRWAR